MSLESSFHWRLLQIRSSGVSGIENDLAPGALGETGEMATGHESCDLFRLDYQDTRERRKFSPCAVLALTFARIPNLSLFMLKIPFLSRFLNCSPKFLLLSPKTCVIFHYLDNVVPSSSEWSRAEPVEMLPRIQTDWPNETHQINRTRWWVLAWNERSQIVES